MKKRAMMVLGVLWAVVFAVGAVSAAPVPDTGVTKCYDDSGEIACPSPGEPFYGQDGNYTINPPSYTKLDSSANPLPDSATSWPMVRDNVTGLIWEVKRNKDGVKNYADPHDADNTYTWYDPDDPWDPGSPSDHDTKDFIDDLNSAWFGGFNDWRLPTIKELAYLVDYSIADPGPTINATYFPNTVSSDYWSSTTYAAYTYGAWLVWFSVGWGRYYTKSSGIYVRAVRGGQSISLDTLVINGDGTVTDTSTGLMWQQDTARDDQGNYEGMTWKEALAYCDSRTLGGHADWRLPTIKELRSLTDYNRYDPAINTDYFANTMSSGYWPSTTHADVTNDAWLLYFWNGYDDYFLKSDYYYVRAVRGGQNRVLGHLFILAPGQGSVWSEGEVMSMRWDTAGLGGNVAISISRQGGNAGTFETILPSTENDGSYDWTVTEPGSVNCMLKIEPMGNPSKGTTQGLFSVTASVGAARYVKKDGVCAGHQPCYSTIQAAIVAAADGDEIWVCHGDYYENVVLKEVKRVRLSCGWDDGFETNGLFSTATALRIGKGSLMVDGLRLKGE